MSKQELSAGMFGKALIMARLAKGIELKKELRVSDVARIMDVSPGYWSRLERGKKIPAIEMLTKITRYYKASSPALLKALGMKVPS